MSISTAMPDARIGAIQCFSDSKSTFSSGMRFSAIVMSVFLAW